MSHIDDFSGLSTCGLAAFTSLTLALQLISPNMVSSLRCLELVLAFLVQSVISRQLPSLVTSAGGGLIIAGIVILAAEERLSRGVCHLISTIQMRVLGTHNPYREDTPLLQPV